MTHKSFLRAAVMISLLFVAGGAEAQKVGTYVGESADGEYMSATVARVDGKFRITGMYLNFKAHCTSPARNLATGYGFGFDQKIVSGENKFETHQSSVDFRGVLRFVTDNKIVGNHTVLVAVFVPGNNPPTKAQLCKSAKRNFTLKFQPPG